MPVYKTEATVAAAIESVLAQTLTDFELIAVDDGSPDKAGEVLAAYAAKDPRVSVYSQENRGLSGARNAGLDRAAGEYVTFLDSDDVLPRHALATFLSAAEATGAAMVVSERPVDVQTEQDKAREMRVASVPRNRVRVSTTRSSRFLPAGGCVLRLGTNSIGARRWALFGSLRASISRIGRL